VKKRIVLPFLDVPFGAVLIETKENINNIGQLQELCACSGDGSIRSNSLIVAADSVLKAGEAQMLLLHEFQDFHGRVNEVTTVSHFASPPLRLTVDAPFWIKPVRTLEPNLPGSLYIQLKSCITSDLEIDLLTMISSQIPIKVPVIHTSIPAASSRTEQIQKDVLAVNASSRKPGAAVEYFSPTERARGS
jgi:hypothetical protein